MMNIWTVAGIVVALNLPFGFMRAGRTRFSPLWFVAVHAPVPLVVVLRIATGVGWRLATVPTMVAAYFAGQFIGGKVRDWWLERS